MERGIGKWLVKYVVKQILKNVKFKIIVKHMYYFLSLFDNSHSKINNNNKNP